eukprot:scpid47919/ scgid23701/ 
MDRARLRPAGVALSLACVLLWLSTVRADFTRVGIGVYVLNVGEVDIAGGSCYLDYLLTIHQLKTVFPTYEQAVSKGLANVKDRICSDTDNADWMEWNGTAKDIAVVNLKRTGEVRPLEYSGQFRVLGDHYFRTRLADWPFETQTLELIIEFNEQLQSDGFDIVFCHINQYSGLSSSIRFPGEESLTLTTTHSVVERCWPPFSAPDATCLDASSITPDCDCAKPPKVYHNITSHFSCRCQGGEKISTRYYGMINFDRPERSAFIKVFMAPMFILLVIILTYWLPPKKDETRFSMCAATLLAGIFFHVNLHNQLPPTSTLTDADTLMINLYIVNLFAWVVTLIIMLCQNADEISDKFTNRVYLFTRILGPILSIPSFIITFFSDTQDWWLWVLVAVLGVFLSLLLLLIQEYTQKRLQSWLHRSHSNGVNGNAGSSCTGSNDSETQTRPGVTRRRSMKKPLLKAMESNSDVTETDAL